MKGRPGGHRRLLAAGIAFIVFSFLVEAGLFALTFRAAEPIGPPHLRQVFPTSVFIRESFLKIEQPEVVIRLFLCIQAYLIPQQELKA